MQVLRSILNGTYSVIGHGDARHIVVLEGKEKILPERITSAADYARFYDVLPRTFVARATLFEGFDPLPLDQNGFELFLSGKPYLSLYHDGRLDDFQYSAERSLVLNLTKVHDSGYGPENGAKLRLEFHDAVVSHIECFGEGNFEDVNELTLLSRSADHVTLRVVIGAMSLTLKTSKVSLEPGV